MFKTLALAAAILACSAGVATAKPACRDAKRHFAKCPAASPAAAPATPAPSRSVSTAGELTGGHPVCKKGKPCGHSCIALSKVCHKG